MRMVIKILTKFECKYELFKIATTSLLFLREKIKMKFFEQKRLPLNKTIKD